jgi:hypothetical protein
MVTKVSFSSRFLGYYDSMKAKVTNTLTNLKISSEKVTYESIESEFNKLVSNIAKKKDQIKLIMTPSDNLMHKLKSFVDEATVRIYSKKQEIKSLFGVATESKVPDSAHLLDVDSGVRSDMSEPSSFTSFLNCHSTPDTYNLQDFTESEFSEIELTENNNSLIEFEPIQYQQPSIADHTPYDHWSEPQQELTSDFEDIDDYFIYPTPVSSLSIDALESNSSPSNQSLTQQEDPSEQPWAVERAKSLNERAKKDPKELMRASLFIIQSLTPAEMRKRLNHVETVVKNTLPFVKIKIDQTLASNSCNQRPSIIETIKQRRVHFCDSDDDWLNELDE